MTDITPESIAALKAQIGELIDSWAAPAVAAPAPPPPSAPEPAPTLPAPAIITGLPFGFTPLYEAGIRTDNSPSINAGRLNDLFAALSEGPGGGRQGGGLIRMTEPGAIPIDGTITLLPGVSLRRESASRFAWAGDGASPIFASRPVDVLTDLDLELFVDEGAAFNGVAVRLHSAQNCRFRCMGYGNNQGSTFVYISADSAAGEWAGGGRNFAFNDLKLQHRLQTGVGLLADGLTAGFGGQAQVVTLNTFNVQFAACAKYGIRPDSWFDTNTFAGQNYAAINGPNGVGFINNPQSPDVETGVYNIHFEHLAIDTFKAPTNLSRYGVALFAGKAFTCDSYFNDPPAENGSLIARASCASYDWGMKADNANSLQEITHNLLAVAR
jgi:hypothetical protein